MLGANFDLSSPLYFIYRSSSLEKNLLIFYGIKFFEHTQFQSYRKGCGLLYTFALQLGVAPMSTPDQRDGEAIWVCSLRHAKYSSKHTTDSALRKYRMIGQVSLVSTLVFCMIYNL